MHRIEVRYKKNQKDPRGHGLLKDILELGVSGVQDIRVADVYWLEGDFKAGEVETLSRELLTDPVTQHYIMDATAAPCEDDVQSLEVAYNAGVADPVEETVLKAAADLGTTGLARVRTSQRYYLKGHLSDQNLKLIAGRLLVNPIVQHLVSESTVIFADNPTYEFNLIQIDLPVEDEALCRIGCDFCLSPAEIRSVAAYFGRQNRKATDVELETLAQTWSEHCVHKTFKAKFDYEDQTIDNLLRSTIARATYELNKGWCLSVFEDNAGVIDFDGENAICFKVETHNHPSAVEPYGGAATGLGGVIRDVLGTGLAARPVFNTDVFCFGPPDLPYDELPAGVLHPRRVFKGVRAGVADYGNRMGIPTVNGAVLFDKRYTANPLVYCGTAGIMPIKAAKKGRHEPGDLVVLVGGRTGRDGIHGVTFSSEKLTAASAQLSCSAVQIGNPIIEKKAVDAVLKARDQGLFNQITDCGGGGLSSAVGEMGESTGVKVYLDRVPLKYSGLNYTEIWISESQERMVLSVPPKNWQAFWDICRDESTEATVIGEFTDDKKLTLYYDKEMVGQLDMDFLHGGRPQLELKAKTTHNYVSEPVFTCPASLKGSLLAALGDYNVCSKEWVIRQYDHEVQGGSVIKPLTGTQGDGPSDAAVILPVLGSRRAVAVSCGINPNYGDVSPYDMAASAIDEAVRNIIAVGGSLERLALLDNFCWGSVSEPESLGALIDAAQACYDVSLAYGAPFISGKDSLNNQFHYQGKTVSIPPTLLISALAVMPDGDKAVTLDFKSSGNGIYVLGGTYNELGGSVYFRSRDLSGGRAPKVSVTSAKNLFDKLSAATDSGLVRACHDLSEGGLAVALAEMAFSGALGASIDIDKVPLGENIGRDDYLLFSESNSRFLVEVSPEHSTEFEKVFKGSTYAHIGEVSSTGRIVIKGLTGNVIIDASCTELKEAWQAPLRW